MDNSLSERLNQLVMEKYPEYADKLKQAFGIKDEKTQEVKQLSLNPNTPIDQNLNSLVDKINDPSTSQEDRIKALASYNMIVKRMQENK